VSIKITFECSGCFVTVAGTRPLGSRWDAIHTFSDGGSVGRYVDDRPQDVAPEGWVAFDPYTRCCYCPKCWASIIAPKDGEATAVERVGAAS